MEQFVFFVIVVLSIFSNRPHLVNMSIEISASVPKYVQVLNEHPTKYPKVFRQHRDTDHSPEDRLMADKNLTISDKLAFLDMLHQPDKKSTDEVAHSNNGDHTDRSRRSFTNADSLSNNDDYVVDDNDGNDVDDDDEVDNSPDDWNKLIESNHRQRSAW
jgi:hypothetical protein